MKLTIGLKLKPTKEQARALRQTLERANAAANEISRLAWERKVFGQFGLQKLTYHSTREKFSLSAQVVVRVTAKVADAYKLDKRRQRVFRADGSIAFDDRILRYGTDYVSIWTLEGRQQIPFVCGPQQRRLLHARLGESDLVFRKGKWYLFATVNVIEPLPDEDPEGWLGVDFGIARIASDSEGRSFSGAHTRNLRRRHRKLRAKLQGKGTKSAKRLLRKRAGKERRFAKDINHQISKAIVGKAQRTKQAIVLEDLKGLRLRVRASRRVRAELHSWSFAQAAGIHRVQSPACRGEGDRGRPAQHQPRMCSVWADLQIQPAIPISVQVSGLRAGSQRRHQRCAEYSAQGRSHPPGRGSHARKLQAPGFSRGVMTV